MAILFECKNVTPMNTKGGILYILDTIKWLVVVKV